MPVVTLDVPLGSRPKAGTRDRLIDWLSEHVGPITEIIHFHYRYDEDQEDFHIVQNEYYKYCGLPSPYYAPVIKYGVTGGDAWKLFQTQSELQGLVRHAFQYVAWIEDEMLAMQYKLACL